MGDGRRILVAVGALSRPPTRSPSPSSPRTSASFDDTAWTAATAYTESQVGAKDGYAEITWDPAAELIWTSSLEQDNTILWRHTVDAP